METVTILFNNKEHQIPKEDLEYFVKEKGAKLVNKKVVAEPKKVSKKNNKNK